MNASEKGDFSMSEKGQQKPRISRLVVGLGKTSRPSSEREEWVKTHYEIEFEVGADVTPDEFEKARKAALQTVETWFSESISKSPLAELNPSELDKLPWKEYKSGHRNAWIFANTKGAEKLLEAIKSAPNGKVEIGGFAYRLSGKDLQFISRTIAQEATQK
jgi:hypothetical protein